MKSEIEIQRAHDLLLGMVMGEAPSVAPQKEIILALDVLCWVLEHEHNPTFGTNLKGMETELLKRGVVLTRRNN